MDMAGLSQHLPAVVRLLRSRSGLTQAELEVKAGVGQGKLSEWETGQSLPRLSSLDAALDAMGMNLHHLADALDEVQGRGTGEVREPVLLPERHVKRDVDELRTELALRMTDMMAAALREIHQVMSGSGSGNQEAASHERRHEDPAGPRPARDPAAPPARQPNR